MKEKLTPKRKGYEIGIRSLLLNQIQKKHFL